jgi:hypothetical protein
VEGGICLLVGLRKLKLKLLDLVAPCRLHALFFPERKTADGNDAGVGSADDHRSMGISRTVALMVLLAGDSDPDVRNKAESYLRSHMDTYRGKEVGMDTKTIHDALLGNSVGLARTILTLAIGGTVTYYGKSPPPPSVVLYTKTTVMTHANYTYRPRRICTSTYNVYPPGHSVLCTPCLRHVVRSLWRRSCVCLDCRTLRNKLCCYL